MKKRRNAMLRAALALLVLLWKTRAELNAHAGYTWEWFTDVRAVDMLPWVILVAIAIETAAICCVLGGKQVRKVFLIVCGANLFSFLLPPLFIILEMTPVAGSLLKAVSMYANRWEFYSAVNLGYLTVMILVEIPLEYRAFENQTEKPRWLKFAVISANILTTVLCTWIEMENTNGFWIKKH